MTVDLSSALVLVVLFDKHNNRLKKNDLYHFINKYKFSHLIFYLSLALSLFILVGRHGLSEK